MAEKASDRELVLKISSRGVISIPKQLRGDADVFSALRRSDGVIELRPKILIDSSQAWFWSENWQRMEREADDDIAAGRVRVYDSDEAMIADLKRHRSQNAR